MSDSILLEIKTHDGGKGLLFYCPGCRYDHFVTIEPGTENNRPIWTWNGDMEKPTFSPSLGVNMQMSEMRCHSFIRDGKIEYLSDSFHELRGKTVDMQWIDR